MKKRGSALIWILVVLVLVVIGVIAYVLIVKGDVGIKDLEKEEIVTPPSLIEEEDIDEGEVDEEEKIVIPSKECMESWNCTNWSSCVANQQTRTCIDNNSCGILENKPSETQSCSTSCTEDWECNNWTSCINNERVRSCTDENNCGKKKDKPNVWELCGQIEEGTHYKINEVLFYKKSVTNNNVSCLPYGYSEGSCNITSHLYRGIIGEDEENHFDGNGLFVLIITSNNLTQNGFINSINGMYGFSPEERIYENNNYYYNAEVDLEYRLTYPGEADEGIYWSSENKYIFIFHNGFDVDPMNLNKTNIYFNALLEIYTEEFPSDLVFS